jgi:hypothetical protein
MNTDTLSLIFEFPDPIQAAIIETGMMRWAMKRTTAVHHLGGFCMWSGRAGMGKTTAAQQMVKLIEEGYAPSNPKAFRAVHYEAGSVEDWTKNEAKRGIRSLYCGVGYGLDEGAYRGYLPEELAADLVHFLIKTNTQFIFVDEAGLLSRKALRGMATVSDTAKLKGWTLTIVLIGMDNLPTKLADKAQLERRVYEWIYFKPCTLEETLKLLATLHPYFETLSLKDKGQRRQVQYIHDACKGMPGSVVPFASRFRNLFDECPGDDPMTVIQAAHIQPLYDKNRSISDSQSSYQGLLDESESEEGEGDTPNHKESGHSEGPPDTDLASEVPRSHENVMAFRGRKDKEGGDGNHSC